VVTRTILTYADYAALPDDGQRYELHEGELVLTPAPGTSHQGVLIDLGALLHRHVKEKGLGRVFVAPTDCILSDITVLQPDILFVDTEHRSLISARAVEGPPTLVVEVLSPTTARRDRGGKRDLYAQHGVPWYWIVESAARRIDAYRLVGDTYQLAAPLTGPGALPPFLDLIIDATAIWL
jgi:Uma2 family endonuclease